MAIDPTYGTDGLRPVGDEDLGFGATVRGFVEGQRLFDRYTLNRILGRGGMGVVWLAMDERLERPVAMKFLPELIKLDTAALDELKRETRRSLELTHANIVRIYDFVDDATAAAISMEYVDGATLSAWRVNQPNKVFEVAHIREWMLQMIEALDYAHRKAKLVHRDLKPANLMVTSDGELKVADFGIARSISDSVSRVTMQQGSSGTLAYMSPQQAMGDKPTVTDDIYAFGATVYELLTSKPPFFRGDLMVQLREKVPQSMAEQRAEFEIVGEPIPPEWEQVIAACLAKDAAARPQSMGEVGERLGLMIAKSTTRNTQPPATKVKAAPAPSGPPKKLPVALIAGIAAAVLVLAGLGWYFGVERPAQQEKLRQAELAQQEAIQKEKDLEAKAAADAAEKTRLEAEAKKAADEAEALRTAQEKAKADADAKAAAEAAIAKAAADQKAKDDAAAAKAAADQKAADDAAKLAAQQQAAADATAKLAAAQKAAEDAAKALAAQKAAASGGDASGGGEEAHSHAAEFDGNGMLTSCLTMLPNGVILYHPEVFAANFAGKEMEFDGTVARLNTSEHLAVFKGGGIYPRNWDLQLAMNGHTFTAGRTYHVVFRLNTINAAPFAGYSFRGRVISSSSEK